MPIEKRSRNFSIVTYLDERQISEVIKRNENKIRAYAFCKHDKDDKEIHTHLVIALFNATTESAIKKWFYGYFDKNENPINTLVQITHDVIACYDYLIHNTEECRVQGKFQYSPDCIKSYNDDFFKSFDSVKEDNLLNALEDMLNGEPLRDIAKRYGRDFIMHYGHIKTLFVDIYSQENIK